MRRVFFSFHYEDSWRVNQVRNMWVGYGSEAVRIYDAAAFEQVKRRGDAAIKNWIDQQMNGTSVTVVLIGSQTYARPYVNYEISRSIKRGNGLLGIHINGLKGQDGRTKRLGRNPLDQHQVRINGFFSDYETAASDYYETFDGTGWLGFGEPYHVIAENIGDWVEEAARLAGRLR